MLSNLSNGTDVRESLRHLKQYLLSGVSYVIPFVACGGILVATAIALAPMKPDIGPDFSQAPFLKLLMDIGTAAFSLVVPVLAGYIAFGMVDRPGLVPGFVGGFVASALIRRGVRRVVFARPYVSIAEQERTERQAILDHFGVKWEQLDAQS